MLEIVGDGVGSSGSASSDEDFAPTGKSSAGGPRDSSGVGADRDLARAVLSAGDGEDIAGIGAGIGHDTEELHAEGGGRSEIFPSAVDAGAEGGRSGVVIESSLVDGGGASAGSVGKGVVGVELEVDEAPVGDVAADMDAADSSAGADVAGIER